MSSIEVVLPDHDDIMMRLNTAIEHTPEQLNDTLKDSAVMLERALKTDFQARTHGSGATAASIESRQEQFLQYGVGSYSRGHILRFLDKGTGIYSSRGKPILIESAGKALHFWVKETGEEVFAAYCIVMGIIPYGFFDRLVNEHLSQVDAILNEKVKI